MTAQSSSATGSSATGFTTAASDPVSQPRISSARVVEALIAAGVAAEVIIDPNAPSRVSAQPSAESSAGIGGAANEAERRIEPSSRTVARIRCDSEQTVLAALRACTSLGLPVSVLGGGFSPAALGEAPGSVCLDLASLDSIRIDEAEQTVTIGGGVTAGQLERALDGTGFAINLPVPSRIGVAGAVLSGGVGVLLRQTGFLSDQLLAARLIDGMGELREASATQHPDLLHALRGGGGNFGAVTSLTLRLTRLATISVAQLAFAHEHAAEALQFLHGLTEPKRSDAAAAAPDPLTAVIFLRALPPLPGLNPALVGTPGVFALLTHAGDEVSASAALAPALEHTLAATAVTARLTPLQLRERMDRGFPFERFGAHFRSGFADALSGAQIEAIAEAASPAPSPHAALEIVPLGGAITGGDGCAPGRDAAYMINIMGLWVDPAHESKVRAWVEKLDGVLGTIRRDAARVPGFIGSDEAPSVELGAASYAADLEQLTKLKLTHDPKSLFSSTFVFLRPTHE